jgi:CheY-like chemotaxis protein
MDKIKVLLVEDNEIIQHLVRNFLLKNSCIVLVANNGEEAIANYLDDKVEFDAIIADIMMPKLNGLELLMYIRKQKEYDETRVIGITSGFSSYLKSLCTETFDYMLTKPLDLDYLLEILQGQNVPQRQPNLL